MAAWNPPRGSKPDYTLLPDSQTHPWLLTTKITKAHRWFVERLLAMEPGTQLGGTYTDKPGYHNMRSRLPADDYSVRQAIDQQGPADKGAGTDWTHPAAHTGDYRSMVKYGQRMRASYNDRGDPRLNGWREALGQFDLDAAPEALDFRGRYERVPDDTHKWHWHLSETRAYVERFDNKWAFLTVLLGWTTAEWQQSIGEAADMPLDNTDKTWLKSAEFTGAIVAALSAWRIEPTHPAVPTRTLQQHLQDLQNLRDYLVSRVGTATYKPPATGSPVEQMGGFDAAIASFNARHEATVAAIEAATERVAGAVGEVRTVLESAGGNADVAPLVARLDALPHAIEQAAVSAGDRAADEVTARIAAGQRAAAEAVGDGTSG